MALLRKTVAVGCLIVGGLTATAAADIRTTGTAIGCLTPDKLAAAEDALKARDRGRMDQLGCFPIAAGTQAKRIDDGRSGALWHVTLDPDGPAAMDVWARASSFRAD